MAYTDIVTAKADATLRARLDVAFEKRALTRAIAVSNAEDQRELKVLGPILDGSAPAAWVDDVCVHLDTLGTLTNPTDAQIDTAVSQVIARLLVVR